MILKFLFFLVGVIFAIGLIGLFMPKNLPQAHRIQTAKTMNSNSK